MPDNELPADEAAETKPKRKPAAKKAAAKKAAVKKPAAKKPATKATKKPHKPWGIHQSIVNSWLYSPILPDAGWRFHVFALVD